mgnify:CR=1 FL=1
MPKYEFLEKVHVYMTVEANSEEEAWAEVTKYEKVLEPLGITPRNRLKKSLYEINRKHAGQCNYKDCKSCNC